MPVYLIELTFLFCTFIKTMESKGRYSTQNTVITDVRGGVEGGGGGGKSKER